MVLLCHLNLCNPLHKHKLHKHPSLQYMDASVPTALGATMPMSVSTEMGVTAPTTASTVTTQMTRPEMGTFMPPFTVGVSMSTSVPTSLRVINTHNFSRDQPYGMPTSMVTNLHNIPAFTEHANPFTPFNTHSPSSSSVFGRSTLPALTT